MPVELRYDGNRYHGHGRLAVFDAATCRALFHADLDEPLSAVGASADGKVVAAGSMSGRLVAWRVADGALVGRIETGVEKGFLTRLAVNLDGTQAVARREGGSESDASLVLYPLSGDGPSLTVMQAEDRFDPLTYVIPKGTAHIVYLDTRRATVAFRDLGDSALPRRPVLDGVEAFSEVLAAVPGKLALQRRLTVEVWSTPGRKLILEIPECSYEPPPVLSPDGRWLACHRVPEAGGSIVALFTVP
jgi:hypothetical protein